MCNLRSSLELGELCFEKNLHVFRQLLVPQLVYVVSFIGVDGIDCLCLNEILKMASNILVIKRNYS